MTGEPRIRIRPLRILAALAGNFAACWAVGYVLGPLLGDSLVATIALIAVAFVVAATVATVTRDWVWAPDQPTAPAPEWTEDRL